MEDKTCTYSTCHTRTVRTEEEKKKLINRLNRMEGQIRGIRRMLEEDVYCIDILTQSAAVTAAMNGFNKELVASHLRTCVAEDVRRGNGELLEEVIQTLQKLMK